MPDVPTRLERTAYHHGNLHEALVDAGLALTRTGGRDALSLRDVTRRAGVSPTAAYRHFADRDALLDAVSQRIQADVAARMHEKEQGDAPAGGRAQLRAVGLGYIGFAVREPGWFDVAFGEMDALPGSGELPAPLRALVSALDTLVVEGELDPALRAGAEWPCWSAVHGFALLALTGPLRALSPADRDRAAERTVDTAIAGLLAAR